MRSVAGLVLVPAALVLGACASSGEPPLLELTPWEPPMGQSCQLAGGGYQLQELVDSSAATAAVERLRPSDGALLLSVRASHEDQGRSIHRIETTLPEAEATELEAALEPLYRDTPAWGRLLVRTGQGRVQQLALGASRTCAPALKNEWVLSRMLTAVARDFRREGTVNMLLRSDSTGALADAQVNRSSGRSDFDAAVMSVARYAQFHPALVDRRPIPIWVSLDFDVTFACPSPPPGEEWPPGREDPCGRRDAR